MTEPKFCKDCAHYVKLDDRSYEGYRCATRVNLVDGTPIGWPNDERKTGACGPKGKLFVSPLWPFPEKEPMPRWKLWLARVIGL